MKQPFFVGGIKDVEVAKGSAFGAMIAFIVTFGISIVVWIRDTKQKRRAHILSRHTYDQVPPPEGLQDYEIGLDLPTSATEAVFT